GNKATLMVKAYSFRSDCMGLPVAALRDCHAIVANATPRAIILASMNTTGPIVIRQAKPCSHLFIAHQQSGIAIIMAMSLSLIKSFERMITIVLIDDLSILGMAISFVS